MTDYLYKVSPPRLDRWFHPTPCWHTPDWESSTDKPRDGYFYDEVLFAGTFSEINIHLFPRLGTIRVRQEDATAGKMKSVGFNYQPDRAAYIFVHQQHQETVLNFAPTIFRFQANNFKRVRKGEYVTTESHQALSSEVVSIPEALDRFTLQLTFVENYDDLKSRLSNADIYFDEQT